MADSLQPHTVHGILQARILERVAIPLLQGIFPTQGSNPGLPHCRKILYQLSHKGGLLNQTIKTKNQITKTIPNNHF